MKMFLVEGIVYRKYFGQDEDRLEDTRIVMAVNEVDAGAKYENWWIAKTEPYTVYYYANKERVHLLKRPPHHSRYDKEIYGVIE